MSRSKITIEDGIRIWNGPGNAAVREATKPPRGPTGSFVAPVGGPTTLKGGDPYQVFVAVAIPHGSILMTTPPPPGCFVYFRYPGDDSTTASMLTIRTAPDLGSYDLSNARLYNNLNDADVAGFPEASQAADGTITLLPPRLTTSDSTAGA